MKFLFLLVLLILATVAQASNERGKRFVYRQRTVHRGLDGWGGNRYVSRTVVRGGYPYYGNPYYGYYG